MTYKVGALTDERRVAYIDSELREPGPKQVLVRVDYCAICTLEQRIFSGVMKRYPFAGGHEAAGTVVGVGEKVKDLAEGDKVALRLLTSCGECYYCRSGHENQCVVSFIANTHKELGGPGGFAEYMMMDAKAVYRMSPDIDLAHAALAEPLACCVHSIRNARIELGEDVVVIGVGIMGALHIQLAKLQGARVIACEVDPERLRVAREMGADIVVDSGSCDAVERVKELTEGRGADVVICTSAISRLAADSIAMAGKLGRVVMYSSFHPDNPVELSANRVHSTEMIITGAVNPNTRDFLASTRLLSNGIVDVSKLISGVYPLEQLEEALTQALDPKTYRILVSGH